MKTKLFRKLAAVGVSALTLASSVAMAAQSVPSDLTRDFFFSSTGTNANFVVGSIAHPLDAIVAANIGAALASHAYTTTTVTPTGGSSGSDATVTITVGSTEETKTDGKVFNADANFANSSTAEFVDQNANYSQVTVLHRDLDKEFTEDEDEDYEIDVEEKIQFTADVEFSVDEDYHVGGRDGLFASIDRDQVTYTVDFGSGLREFDNLNSDETDDGAGVIYFLGMPYNVLQADLNDGIKLATLGDLTSLYSNEPVAVEIDGTDYMLELVNIFLEEADGEYRGTFQLWSADGTTKVGTLESDVQDGDTIDFGGAVTDVFIQTLGVQTAGANAGKGQAQVQLTGRLIELQDSDDLADSIDGLTEDQWDVAITTSGTVITVLTISNDGVSWDNRPDDDEDVVLYSGDEAVLPLDFATVEFRGFEAESLTDVKIGSNEIDGFPTFYFVDQDNSDTETSVQLFASGTLTVNGHEFEVVDVNAGSTGVKIREKGSGEDEDDLAFIDVDNDLWAGTGIESAARITKTTAYNTDGDTFEDRGWELDATYGLWLDSGETSTSKVYFLLLDDTWTTEHGFTIEFEGTDLNEANALDFSAAAGVIDSNLLPADAGYYIPLNSDVETHWNADANTTDIDREKGVFASRFEITHSSLGGLTGTGEFEVLLDTFNGRPVDQTDDTDSFGSSSGVTYEVNYTAQSAADLAFEIERDDETDDSVQSGYIRTGARAALMNVDGEVATTDSDYAEFWLPQSARQLEIFLGATTTTPAAENVKVLSSGESYDGITVTSIGGGAGAGEPYDQVTKLNFDMRTSLDNAPGPGNLIVIGSGHVNSLTKSVETAMGYGTALANTTAGNWTIDLSGNRLYVFGYTKEDTKNAGDALISWINTNL